MDALEHIQKKFSLQLPANNRNAIRQLRQRPANPIEIPDIGRNDLAAVFADLGFNQGAEIGTFRGEYAEVLCKANPGLHLYCVDPWEAYEGYIDFKEQDMLNMDYLHDKETLSAYDCTLVRSYSVDAVKEFADDTLDFVYIDGNHNLLHVIQDICLWNNKVKKGGIVSGHDFIIYRNPQDTHVVQAVTAYVWSYMIQPWFVLGEKSVKPGGYRDKYRSWMWVKC